MTDTNPNPAKVRTPGPWEAVGVVVQTPPQAVIDAEIEAKGWSTRHVICRCERPVDAQFIAQLANGVGQ